VCIEREHVCVGMPAGTSCGHACSCQESQKKLAFSLLHRFSASGLE